MSKPSLHSISQPQVESDPLHELVRSDALNIISVALEAEIAQLPGHYSDLKYGPVNSLTPVHAHDEHTQTISNGICCGADSECNFPWSRCSNSPYPGFWDD